MNQNQICSFVLIASPNVLRTSIKTTMASQILLLQIKITINNQIKTIKKLSTLIIERQFFQSIHSCSIEHYDFFMNFSMSGPSPLCTDCVVHVDAGFGRA